MMPEKDSLENKNMKICLLGASFDTGNMGVSALAESSIKIILNRWPDAEIVLPGDYKSQQHCLSLAGKEICIRNFPLSVSKNIFLPYHFLRFTFYGLLARILPSSGFKDTLMKRNPYFKELFGIDLVVDITGGDSFSDIYGFRRFFLGFLCKWLIIFLRKKLILLPQTYGPFKRPITKMMARYIVTHADLVYSRDRTGVEYIKNLLNNHTDNGKVRFVPDVAFVLDARKPEHLKIDSLIERRTKETVVVGFNISGLLFNGGYTRDNMFGLKISYSSLVYEIIDLFIQHENVVVILIPHVFPPIGYEVESDSIACVKVYESIKGKYKNRIFLPQGEFSHNEVKYIIGLCDFFIGSRMHSCIAAMSQCIPTVGVAYSRKFQGVFESLDLGDNVANARSCDEREILKKIKTVFENKDQVRKHLVSVIPQVKKNILNIFEGLKCS